MTKEDKLNEGQLQLNVREHYRPLESPMVEETGKRVLNLINELFQGNFIHDMTEKWLSHTYSALNTNFPHPDKNPQTYTSRKTNNIGLPRTSQKAILLIKIIVDKVLLQIAQQQKSYLIVTMDFIEKTKPPKGVILVSVDVTSLYTNIQQEEGIFNKVRTAYKTFYNETPPIPKSGHKINFFGKEPSGS